MEWPSDVRSLLVQFAAKFPAPKEGDDSARLWILRFAQTVCYALGPRWGTKRTGNGAPQTKDVLCYLDPNGTLWGWDLLYASGSPDCVVIVDPGTMDITGQQFIAVAPVNHLAPPVVVPPVTPPQPPQPPVVGGDIEARVAKIEAFLGQLYKTWG